MAESAAYSLRSYSGSAARTTLASGITAGATSFDVVDGSSYAGLTNFRVTLNEGASTEEEVEVGSVAGNTFGSVTRGVGDTTAAAHSAGESVEHTSSVRDLEEANLAVVKTLGQISGNGGKFFRINAGATDIEVTSDVMPKSGGTFTGTVNVVDDPYDATTWNGSTAVPTKNAVRDKIESLASSSGATIARKTADESVTSSTTLQGDDHLVFAIGASETWIAELTLFVSSTTDANDIQLDFVVPTAATGTFGAIGLAGTATTTIGDVRSAAGALGGGALGFAAISGMVVIRVFVLVVNSTNAGNVQLRWAQDTSNAAALTVKANSYLVAQKVS